MRFWRTTFTLLFLAGAVLALGQPRAVSAARSPKTGTVTGKFTRAISGRVVFKVDGVRTRGTVTGSRFSLGRVPSGSHTISFVQAGTNTGAHVAVKVKSGGTSRLGSIALEPGGQITGIVSKISTENGVPEPIAGVEVIARADGKVPPDGGGGDPGNRGKFAPVELKAVTDDSGTYALRGVSPGGYTVSVVVPGLDAGVEYVYVEVGRTAVADFQLREHIEDGVGTVFGRVTNADGEPLEGAYVSVWTDDIIYYAPAISPISIAHARALGRAIRPSQIPRGQFNTLTDEQGEYRLNLPTGHLYFSVWLEGYAPVSQELTLHPREKLEINLKLERDVVPPPDKLGVLEGLVFDRESGAPIAGAEVSIGSPNADGTAGDGYITLVTGKDGGFRAELPEGAVYVQVYAEGYAAGESRAKIRPGTATYLEIGLGRHKR